MKEKYSSTIILLFLGVEYLFIPLLELINLSMVKNGKLIITFHLQEWSVETMHLYKDCALGEDACKTNKGAFSLSILRSIVINILHLNQVENIARQITINRYSLTHALALFSFVRLEYGFYN